MRGKWPHSNAFGVNLGLGLIIIRAKKIKLPAGFYFNAMVGVLGLEPRTLRV